MDIVLSSWKLQKIDFFHAHSRGGNVKTSISSFLLTFRLNPPKKSFSAPIRASLIFFSIHFQNKLKIFILFNFFTDEYVSTNCEKIHFFIKFHKTNLFCLTPIDQSYIQIGYRSTHTHFISILLHLKCTVSQRCIFWSESGEGLFL